MNRNFTIKKLSALVKANTNYNIGNQKPYCNHFVCIGGQSGSDLGMVVGSKFSIMNRTTEC